ncbi:MAG: PKD domain-containing protein [Candidatus Dormiibacterota bacterium]
MGAVLACTSALSAAAAGPTPPTPPLTECPAIGNDTSCGLLIVVNPDGTTTVVGDPSQQPFDGLEDTLVGVLNNSPQTISIIPLSSSGTTPIFDFDGDGLCSGFWSGTPSGCPFGPTGYEGPNTSFSISDSNVGTVNFTGGLAPGGQTYFSLEGAPTASSIIVPRYVGLGDSYQSGEGVPPFISGTDQQATATQPRNLCHRSNGAYPELNTGRTNVPSGVEFWACSGAEMHNFYNGQYNEPGQISQLAGKPATLVTLGVGGNDIKFDTIATTCTSVNAPWPFGQQNDKYHSPCGDYLAKNLNPTPDALITGLTSGIVESDGNTYKLPTLYSDIRKAAQLARVYVVGYPNPLPLSGSVNSDCTADVLYEDDSRVSVGPYNQQFTVAKGDVQWMEKIYSRLNSTIQMNALDAGFYFIDNSLTLKDHDICRNDKTHWLHGVVVKKPSKAPSEFSYHPNGAGQIAIANVVASAIAGPSVGGFRSRVFPGGFVQLFLPVANGQLQLIVETAWPGSDVQLSLISPSNVVYDRNTHAPGVIHQLQSNGETLAITNPEAGQWTVQLYGANVAPQGEDVRVDTTQIAQSAFAPVAGITASADRGVVPVSVRFDGSASRAYNGASIASYAWDFGDGSAIAGGAAQTHTFASAGPYTVTLTVTDTNGLTDSATSQVNVTGTDQPPAASFIWGPDPSGTTPTQMFFNGSASSDVDGQITNYAWDFGDGSTGSGGGAAHVYSSAGSYNVKLTVTDNGGLSGSLCQSVTAGQFSTPGVLQPCRQDLVITASDAMMTYGGAPPAITPSYAGFVNGDTPASLTIQPTCTSTATPTTAPGTYPGATSCSGASSSTYTITYHTGKLTVTPAALTITAANQSITYGDAIPAPTYAITGFVNGETLATSGVTGAATCSTAANTTSPASTYPITCTQGTLSATNYTFSNFVAGSLTIAKHPATLGYTGGLFFSTGSTSAATASVTLQGILTPAPGGSPDLTRATPVFYLYKSSNVSMTTPDLTCPATVTAAGAVSCVLPALGVDNWTVVLRFPTTDGYFTGPAADPVVLTVYQPAAGIFATGGGWVVDPSYHNIPVAISAQNNHGNFGFNVRYKNRTTTPHGQAVYVFRGADGYDYIVKSNSWQGGGAAFTPNSASFSGKANVTVIDPSTGLAVTGLGGGNFTFRVDVTAGSPPTLAISVYDPTGVLYHQAGTTSSQLPLGGGNVVIHQ